ncbi:DUF3870 domain-containing protein [Thermanaeromonas sp. C210]|uniref:DUF3870 domain-containing protein n=1 Tax=Thermanaeromonas sp. C210 TaxID=2731925 RepID=UPI0015633370|nr:DUF3870 domain-containing protein [Thermanaeromonas sp. C210]
MIYIQGSGEGYVEPVRATEQEGVNGTRLRQVTRGKEEDTLLITGYAKLPSTIAASKLYEVVAVAVEVRPEDGEIIDVDCILPTIVARRVVKEIAIGYKLSDGIEGLIKEIERRYCGNTHKDVIIAFRVIYDKYRAYREGRPLQQIEERSKHRG